MNYSDCKTRLVLTQQDDFILLQNEYYVDVPKDGFEVGEINDHMSLFHFTNIPRKKLSKKGKLDYALKQLQEYKDEPFLECEYEEGVWDKEAKNKFADYLIERLQESYYNGY